MASNLCPDPGREDLSFRQEALVRGVLFCATLISGLAVGAILGFLVYFSLPLVIQGQAGQVFAWRWRPFQGDFGILPMIVGSLLLAFSALLLAFPLGVGLCGFVLRQRPKPWGRLVLAVVRLMTGIPTVVYGFVSVFLLVPLIRTWFAQGPGFNWLAATLSGGQQQRLCLARVLALEPAVLLLDEPTASLDFRASQKIEELLLTLKERYAILAVSHSLSQARRLGDQVLVFHAGRQVGTLEPADLQQGERFQNLLEEIF